MKAETMDGKVDTVGLLGCGTAFGFAVGKGLALALSISPWIGQLGLSLLTMAAGAIMLHFLKRELDHRWPRRRRENREPDKRDTSE